MVAISQTFNQRNNDNNDKDNGKTDADANVAPLDVDEKSHWAQFAAPGPLATPSNVDAETLVDAARAGVDETPDSADKLKTELNETVDAICASFRAGKYEPPSQEEIESALRRAVDYTCDKRNRCAGGDATSCKTSDKASETPKRPGLTKTVTHYDGGEFVCWFPNDVDAGAELARFVEAASKTAVRVALAEAKSSLLTQILTLPTPRRVADIRQYYHQTVQGLALSVVAELGTDAEKLAVVKYLSNAMGSDGASQTDDETPDDAASSSEDGGDQEERESDLRDVVQPEAATVEPEAFLKLGKFYGRASLPFACADEATFERILTAINSVFPPNELVRPWNVTDKVSAFCDALQNDGATRDAALPIAKEAVKNATEAASSLFWGGAKPEPKQRWNAARVKPSFNVEIGDALKPTTDDKTSFTDDAAEAEASE